MSSQHPESGSRPVTEFGSDAPAPVPSASAPAPVTTPYSDGRAPGGQPAYAPARDAAPEAAPGWGAPARAAQVASAGKPWTVKRGLAVAGAAVVLAAGAGVGVYALTSSSAAAASGTAAGVAGGPGSGSQGSVPGMPGSPQGGFAGGGMSGQGGPDDFAARGMGGGLSAAVHAEYVVLNGSAYTTMAEQLGTVTEVSSSSVTVKSSDGFTRSYDLGGDVVVSSGQQRRQQSGTGTQLSVADIVAGGTLRVVAAKAGSGYSASSVQITAATAPGQSS